MARSNLPGNILKQANTGLLSQLLAGNKVRAGIQDAQVTGAEDTVQDYSNLSAQNLMAELQGVTAIDPRTGVDDPIMAAAKRQQMVDNRSPWDLTNMEKVNAAMPLMETKGKADYLTDVAVKNQLRTESHKFEDRTQLAGLPSLSDPSFKETTEGQMEFNRVNGIKTPQVDARYLQHFDTNKFVLKPDTISNAVGDINDPKKYDTKARDRAINTIADNLGIQYSGITDRKVLESKAVELLGLDPAGRKFDLRTAAQSKETYGSVEMDKYSSALATSMGNAAGISLAKGNTPAQMRTASEAVTKDMNAVFTHMKQFDVSPEQRERIMPSIMQALATTDLIEGSGRRAGFGEARLVLESMYPGNKSQRKTAAANALQTGKITVGIQSKLKQGLRRIYQDRFKNTIPNDILDKQIDDVLNNDSALTSAMKTGSSDAAALVRHREEMSLSHQQAKAAQGKKLNEMIGTGLEGTPVNTIYDDTLANLVKAGAKFDESDRGKLKQQLRNVWNKIEGFFSVNKGNQLTNQGREAMMLAARRMFVNNVSVQNEGSFFKGLWFKADFDLTGVDGDMDDNDQREVLELLYENLPRPERSIDSVATGIDTFKNKLVAEINTLKDTKALFMDQQQTVPVTTSNKTQ